MEDSSGAFLKRTFDGVLYDLQVNPHKNVPISICREEVEREEKNNPFVGVIGSLGRCWA